MSADRSPADRLPPVRSGAAAMHVDIRTAAVAWLGCWFAGNLVGSAVVAASGAADGPTPIWAVAVAA